MPEPSLQLFDDLESMSHAACAQVLKAIGETSGRFSLVLAGGKTPRRLYELLAVSVVDWERVHLFWGDERCVPRDHPSSNYKLVRDSLLTKAAIPPQNVHAVPEIASPEEAAAAYENELRRYFRGPACFDVVLLGMGPDGHTASLFPGAASLREEKRWAVADDGKQGDPPMPRVTLTLPMLNSSKMTMFLVSGEQKKDLALRASSGDGALPAGRVRPSGKLVWYFAP